MKRIINFRSFLIIFAIVVSSILIALFSFKASLIGLIFLICLFIVLALSVTLMILNKVRLLKILTFSIAILLTASASINFIVTLNSWTEIDSIKLMDVKGTVENVVVEDEVLILNLYKLNFNDEKVKGKMRVKIKNFQKTKMEFVKVGDTLEFSNAVKPINLIENYKINGSNYRKNYRYFTQATEDIFKLTIGKPTLLQKFSLNLKAALVDNMGELYGNLAYGMLSGNISELDEDVISDFGVAGLSHILAVSGLHIGFLTTLIAWILSKLKVGRKLTFIITATFLFLYMAFAGFSPSVTRSVIMSLIALITLFNQRRKDALSSLLCAGSLILAIKPLFLFEVGFLMSFTAVLCMILFSKSIKRALRFLPDKIGGLLASSISVQIGITPVMIYFLKNFQLYSVLVNVFAIPFIMVIFIILLILSILTLIFPFMGIFLNIPKVGLWILNGIAHGVTQLPAAKILCFANITIFGCYLIYFAISRFVLVPKNNRWLTATIGCALCLTLMFANDYSFNLKSVIAPIDDPYNSISVVVEQNKTYVIGDFEYSYAIKNKLISMRIKKIDAIFLSEMNSKTTAEIVKLNRFYKISDVYCRSEGKLDGIPDLVAAKINFTLLNKDDKVGNISLVYDKEVFVGYKLKSYTDILFVADKCKLNKVSLKILNKFKIIRCAQISEDLPDSKIYLTYYSNFITNNNTFGIDYESNPNYLFDYFTGKTFRLLEII